MARLSDLVNVNINLNKIKIQGVDIPVILRLNHSLMWKNLMGNHIMSLKKI